MKKQARVRLTKNGISEELSVQEAIERLELPQTKNPCISGTYQTRFKMGDYRGYRVEYIDSGRKKLPIYVYKNRTFLGKELTISAVCKKYKFGSLTVRSSLDTGIEHSGFAFYSSFQK